MYESRANQPGFPAFVYLCDCPDTVLPESHCDRCARFPSGNNPNNSQLKRLISMKNQLSAVCAAAVLSITMSLPAAAQEKDAAKLHRVQMAGKEKHPEINAAIVHLREAKQNLEHAAHDF